MGGLVFLLLLGLVFMPWWVTPLPPSILYFVPPSINISYLEMVLIMPPDQPPVRLSSGFFMNCARFLACMSSSILSLRAQ